MTVVAKLSTRVQKGMETTGKSKINQSRPSTTKALGTLETRVTAGNDQAVFMNLFMFSHHSLPFSLLPLFLLLLEPVALHLFLPSVLEHVPVVGITF